jgi:hypothetical protein
LLVTVLLVTVVIGILVVGTSTTSLIDRQVASRQRGGTEAHYLAQAGLDRLKTALFLALSDLHGANGEFCGPPPDMVIDFGDFVLEPGETSAPQVAFGGAGYFQLQFDRRFGYYVLTSVGWLGAPEDRVAQGTVQLVATAGVLPFGPYHNAIFTENLTAGAAAGVAGTIAAYGSVHVVNGDVDLSEDNIAITYVGTSGVYNNYNGRADGEASNAVEQATKALGESRAYPYDLCSRLKVEKGDVRVGSGAVGIGAAGDEYDGDEWVDAWWNPDAGEGGDWQVQSIEGIYLGDGTVLERGQPQIYSRSGVLDAQGYGELHLPFPRLPDGYPAVPDPLPVVGPLVELRETNCELIVDGVLVIPPVEPVVGETSNQVVCPSGGGESFLMWDEDEKLLTISGTIAVPEDDLSIQPRTAGDDSVNELYFSGLGQFRVGTKENGSGSGTIEIGMEILPDNPGANYCFQGPPGSEQPCDESHGLGFETAGDIDFTGVTGAGATVSGVFYAEGRIDLPQQISIVGSVVGGNVHVQQVPRVLWHPDVALFAEFTGQFGSDIEYEGQWDEVSTEIR